MEKTSTCQPPFSPFIHAYYKLDIAKVMKDFTARRTAGKIAQKI